MRSSVAAYASTSALISFVLLGCSSSSTTETADASAPTDASVNHPDGANVVPDSGPLDDAGLCVGMPMEFGNYAPATQMPGACSPDELTTLNTKIQDGQSTFLDVYNAVGASCQKCVFSNAGDANWQFFVFVPDLAAEQTAVKMQTTEPVFQNVTGPCFQFLSSGGAACGEAQTKADECDQTACAGCVDPADSKACDMAACASQFGAVGTSCGDATKQASLDAACGISTGAFDVSKALAGACGGGGDASAEGGALDGG
jgi:hypothetical protein